MSLLRLRCCCGAELEMRAWLVRDFQADWWIATHKELPRPQVPYRHHRGEHR